MRLIDADALIKSTILNPGHVPYIAKSDVEDAPTIEPERKTGKWLFTDAAPHRVYCSECYKTYVPNKKWSAWAEGMIPRNFCPNCGARMEGEQE